MLFSVSQEDLLPTETWLPPRRLLPGFKPLSLHILNGLRLLGAKSVTSLDPSLLWEVSCQGVLLALGLSHTVTHQPIGWWVLEDLAGNRKEQASLVVSSVGWSLLIWQVGVCLCFSECSVGPPLGRPSPKRFSVFQLLLCSSGRLSPQSHCHWSSLLQGSPPPSTAFHLAASATLSTVRPDFPSHIPQSGSVLHIILGGPRETTELS